MVAYARSFVVFLVSVCLVPGDGPSEQHVRHVNPGRSTLKRYRTSETAAASSSAPPPQPNKTIATKPKPMAKSVTEMSTKEFWEKRRRNQYTKIKNPL